MGVETCVLHGNERVLQILGHGGNGNHNAVFRALVFCDQFAAVVIDEGSLLLVIQGGEIQGRSRVHIALGNPGDRAQDGQACEQDHHQHGADNPDADTDHKGRFFGAGFENASLLVVCIIEIFVIIGKRQGFIFLCPDIVGILFNRRLFIIPGFRG